MWPNTVNEFEKTVANYAGAPYAVAVDSCTNALFLSLMLFRMKNGVKKIGIPKRTYVGVAQAILNAGHKCYFMDWEWSGSYKLQGTKIIDSARKFCSNMYNYDTYRCLSFHWGKHLPIGRGGMILLDNKHDYELLKRMRFDGRGEGVLAKEDNFIVPGYHMIMHPDDAARGLTLMNFIPKDNKDLPNDDYADLSKFEVFK